jgi:hypothetical protein
MPGLIKSMKEFDAVIADDISERVAGVAVRGPSRRKVNRQERGVVAACEPAQYADSARTSGVARRHTPVMT